MISDHGQSHPFELSEICNRFNSDLLCSTLNRCADLGVLIQNRVNAANQDCQILNRSAHALK